jgi:uncharacterized coiled-coil protein SlyX
MKKSELNKFIREEIISTLSEDIADMEKELDAYDQKLDAVIQKKEEAGLEEKVAKSVDDVIDPADYVEIGQGYLKGFKRPHSLKDDDLETLGRKIVKVLAKGDINKAKAAFINEVEVDIPSPTMLKYNSGVKDVKTAALAMLDFYNQMQEKEQVDFSKNAQFKIAIDKLKQLSQQKDDAVTEEEDKEPSDAEIKKNKSLAKAAEELAVLTREMKSLAKKYSKAEGQEKEDLLKKLKSKTKLKKELDKILDK